MNFLTQTIVFATIGGMMNAKHDSQSGSLYELPIDAVNQQCIEVQEVMKGETRVPLEEYVPTAPNATDLQQDAHLPPVGPYYPEYSGGPTMKPVITDADPELFQKDTEKWLRKYRPELSDEQIWDELREIQRLRLKEFYEMAIEIYPDLKDRIPIYPILPPRPRKQRERALEH